MEGTENVWRTIVFGRLDVETGKHLVRYSARERENLFEVVTDDPFVYDGVPESYIDERVKGALDTFDKEGVLFNIAEGLCALPAYFEFKITLVRETHKETRLGSRLQPSVTRKSAAPQGKRFRKVAALKLLLIPLHRPFCGDTRRHNIR